VPNRRRKIQDHSDATIMPAMTAPAAQYVTTPDGYDLAYAASGSGLPLILAPPALNHIQLVWDWPSQKAWLEGLAQRFRLVQFDPRGQGMSGRGLAADFSILDYETDLETLIEHLGFERVVLAASCLFGHAAVRYAGKHPDRVHALILLSTAVSNRAWPIEQFTGLGRENWELLLWSRLPPGLSAIETQTRLEQTRQMITQEDAVTRWNGCVDSDISDILPQICVPTLVLHPRRFIHLSSEEAINLAARLPNARLALVESDDPGDLHGLPQEALAAIDQFFAEFFHGEDASSFNAAGPLQPRLSRRQAEVLAFLVQGKTNREIAAELVISLRTVERHVEELYAKLDVRNRAEAIAVALGRLG